MTTQQVDKYTTHYDTHIHTYTHPIIMFFFFWAGTT